MEGEHNGLQTLIRDKYETTFFVHCYLTRQSVECILECTDFFRALLGFAAFFFFKSSKRLAAFDELVTRHPPSVAQPEGFNQKYQLNLTQFTTELRSTGQ